MGFPARWGPACMQRGLPSAGFARCPIHTRRGRVVQQPQRHVARLQILLASNPGEEAYTGFFRSKVFQSEMVVKEFDSFMSDIRGLACMLDKFPDMDLTGKRMYLDKMEESVSRYEVFMKRVELCEDPAAREYMRYTNAQMLEGGFTLPQMFQGLQQSMGFYRTWVAEEEVASADPAKHQAFLARMKEMWSSRSSMPRMFTTFEYLERMTDPTVVMKAQTDPEFYKAVKEVTMSPNPEAALRKWLDHPNIGPLMAEVWKAMQQQAWKGS